MVLTINKLNKQPIRLLKITAIIKNQQQVVKIIWLSEWLLNSQSLNK